MRYLTVDENGRLRQKTQRSEIDSSQYKIREDTKRYQVSQAGSKYLIDFGYEAESRTTIVCDDPIQFLHAIAFVRAAFPDKVSRAQR